MDWWSKYFVSMDTLIAVSYLESMEWWSKYFISMDTLIAVNSCIEGNVVQ